MDLFSCKLLSLDDNNNDDEILHKRTYKLTKFQEHSRIKDGVEKWA